MRQCLPTSGTQGIANRKKSFHGYGNQSITAHTDRNSCKIKKNMQATSRTKCVYNHLILVLAITLLFLIKSIFVFTYDLRSPGYSLGLHIFNTHKAAIICTNPHSDVYF
jgi:hypothetical protein